MIIIGERVNATRRSIKEAIREHDENRIIEEIQKQDKAGSHYIDLNAGTGSGDPKQETADLNWLIDIALRTTEKKLSLDSSDPNVLQETMRYLDNRRPSLLNSVNGEVDRLMPLLELVGEYGCSVIALAMDDSGIPPQPADRLAVCERILTAANKAGVKEEQIFFDPLVLPMCSDVAQPQITYETLREIKKQFPKAKTTLGLSNVSHGLPQRRTVNQAFLLGALSNGLDSAICDPTIKEIRWGMTMGTLLAGKDRHCRGYSRRIRKGEI
jgi:5-methyltetrahydrofolate--homocysteine methyltransferase